MLKERKKERKKKKSSTIQLCNFSASDNKETTKRECANVSEFMNGTM
jgi:hypothetical protein